MMTTKQIITKHNLQHGFGIIHIKILADLYGTTKIDNVIKIVKRLNTLIFKQNIIKRDNTRTFFCRAYYPHDKINLINGRG